MIGLDRDNRHRPPVWITLIIIVVMLPVFALPTLLSLAGADPLPVVKTLLWGYPLYVLLSGWLAWICYERRRYMTWILIALMILTHIAMWVLVTQPEIQ